VVEVVAVAFCLPETVDVRGIPGRPLEVSEEGLLEELLEVPTAVVAVLLGVGESVVRKEDCADTHCISRIKDRRWGIEGIMRMLR
jgi:hypothetical protein